MIFEMTGRVYYIGDKQPYGSLEKQEIGITIPENCAYPNLMFEAWGETVTKLDNLTRDALVHVKFEPQGKTYQGKDGNMRSYTILKITDIGTIAEPAQETTTIHNT